MGRIKTTPIKRLTNQLVKVYPTAFKKDFDENKQLVNAYVSTKSKKMRNVIAGYVTRLTRKTAE